MIDEQALLLDAIGKHWDSKKWVGAPFEQIKRVSNTKVGSVGQDFIEALAEALQIESVFPINVGGKRSKQSPWDISLEGITFELKTATADVSNKFQFNHVRYHRTYDALLCLGISPDAIRFNLWTKADVATGKAGHLVTMEKGANASYKLTKAPNQLHPIAEFQERFEAFKKAWKD